MSCQQSEMYRAEERVLSEHPLPRLSVSDAQSLVDGWRDTAWWCDRFSQVRWVEFKSDSQWRGSVGAFFAEDGYGLCEMDAQHLNTLYVAHETSHVLASARHGRCGHGPWFARTYLELVYLALGSEYYSALYEAFETDGIDHETDG